MLFATLQDLRAQVCCCSKVDGDIVLGVEQNDKNGSAQTNNIVIWDAMVQEGRVPDEDLVEFDVMVQRVDGEALGMKVKYSLQTPALQVQEVFGGALGDTCFKRGRERVRK